MARDFMTYERELYNYLLKNEDKKPLDFIIQETNKLKKILDIVSQKTDEDIRNEVMEGFTDKLNIPDEKDINYLVKTGKTRFEGTIQHLKDELKFLEIKKRELGVGSIVETEELDLSNSTAVEKIIAYNELGIIEHIRNNAEFGISNNALSKALSLLCGERPQTLRPSLNRLSDKDTDHKDHPYHTTKTVERVKYSLIKLGFKLKN
ncbi:hypothetical protein [Flavobacterium sp. 245]|uniref:hypothetical protein n=1 Tax=Flavobacterium sp. 245 TaxID=2512115 RepID=UPI00105FF464|nr:hypothetical protein [Flavobacterium sp. 245]TDP04078.1 hypothetical protein EV145_101479 [Flavobacterium sp. 245]